MALRYSTDRLEVCDFEYGDEAFLIDLVNSPNWQKYIGKLGPKTKEAATAYIRSRLLESYEKNGFGLFKVQLKSTRIPIGMCGLVNRDYLEHPDLGFAILPEYERLGYTFEASVGCIKYAKEALFLSRLMAITDEQNFASRGLLERLGFEQNGFVSPDSESGELMVFAREL